MTMLESILKNVYPTEAFRNGCNAMNTSFHTYDDDEGLLYEEDYMDEAVDMSDASHWGNGVTKVALVFDNYVLKSSITGYVTTADDEGNYLEEDEIHETFDRDYCEIEYKVYRKAVATGVGKFFAETISLGDGVYMQEKYDLDFDHGIPEGMELTGLIKQYYDSEHLVSWAEFHAESLGLLSLYEAIQQNSLLFAWLVTLYDYNDLAALSTFIEEYEINDLHEGNVGWFGHELKFIDYSGYCSNTPFTLNDKENENG